MWKRKWKEEQENKQDNIIYIKKKAEIPFFMWFLCVSMVNG